ncbi:TP901 family phage tail tape measure protein [Frigoribacterium sp. PhB160]|uniref:phage tail tape measure protein n=1 Tax=Frigoribacterium sp. PhB160 TaxID=2485192 RepID=UPI000F49A2AD|nr:phage tail tape measure protein [Frigoribacterium sp. PhB160]ROS62208.1 TP901 family phage tail tape measure protein [Frigoribacterium sp. PhB160]
MPTELATAYISLVPSMKGAQGEIAKALVPDAQSAGDAAGRESGGRFSSAFKGALGGAAIGAALVGSFAGLYAVGSIFDDVTDTIRVGTGAQGEALEGLSDVAKDVATSVPASFEDAGSAVADLNTRLGLSGDTLKTVASQYLEAGRILGTEVDINATTAAFSAFGIEGEAVSGAMDELFQVSQATGVGINELASSVQKNAPAVQNLGFSFSETAALAGSLDKAGLNTGQVMGSLSKSLVTLAKDGQEPQAAFEGVITQLEGFIDAGDTAGAIDLAGKVFGTKGASQLVGAIQSGTLALDDLVGAAGLSGDTILGVAAETADFAESWTLVKNNALSAIEPLSTAVFNLAGNAMGAVATKAQELAPVISAGLTTGLAAVGPLLSGLGSTLGPLIGTAVSLWQAFSPLSLIFQVIQPLLPTLLGAFAQLATTLGGALTTVLQSLLSALAPVVTVLSANLTTVLATLLPVILQLAGTLAGVFAGALTTLAPQIGLLAATVGSVLTTVLAALGPVLGLVAGLLVSVLGAVMPLIPVIISLVAAILPLVAQLIGALAPVLVSLVPLFAAIIQAIAPLITTIIGVLVPVIQALLPVITTVFGVIVSIITAAMQVVQGIIQVVTGIITGNWSQVWTGLGNIVAGAWNLIKSIVSGALSILGAVIGAALNGIRSIFSGVWNGLVGLVRGAWSGITGAISAGVSSAVGFVSGLPRQILGALGGLAGLLLGVGRDMMNGFIEGVKATAGRIRDAVLGPIKDSVDAVKNFLGIHSPSRLMRGLGRNTGEGYEGGVLDSVPGVRSAFDSMVEVPDAAAFAPRVGAGAYLAGLRGPSAAEGAGVLPSEIALYDADGSILTKARVISKTEVKAAARDTGTRLSAGRQRIQ